MQILWQNGSNTVVTSHIGTGNLQQVGLTQAQATALGNGTVNAQVWTRNANGQVTSGSDSFGLDIVAPAVPVLTSSNLALTNLDTVTVSMAEAGTVYLVRDDVIGQARNLLATGLASVNSLANLTALPNDQWNQLAVLANTPTTFSLQGLAAGTYHLFAADAVGNLGSPTANTVLLSTPSVLTVQGRHSANSVLFALDSETMLTGDSLVFSFAPQNAVDLGAQPRPLLQFTLGGKTRYARFDAGNSTASIQQYTYTPVAGDFSAAGAVSLSTTANPLLFADRLRVAGTDNAPRLDVAALGTSATVGNLGSDSVAPQVIAMSRSFDNGSNYISSTEISFDVVFNEDVTGLTASSFDIKVAGVASTAASISSVTAVADANAASGFASRYTVTVRPASNTTQDNLTISLKARAVQDAANNSNTSTSLGNGGRTDGAVVLAIDMQEAAPTVALREDTGSSNSDGITNDAALTVTVDSQLLTYSAYLNANTLQAGATPLMQWRQTDGDSSRAAWHDVAITATQMTIPAVLAEGNHSYEFRVIDALGNISSSTTSSFTLDTVAPAANPTVIVFSGETIRSNDLWDLASGVISLSGGVETGGKWSVAKDGGVPTFLSGSVGTVYNLDADTNSHSYQIRGLDLAGNATLSPITFSAAVNPALLQNPVIGLPEDPLGATGRTLTKNPQALVRRLIPSLAWSYRVDGAGNWIVGTGTSFNFSEGTHSYEVRVTNAAGTVVASTAVAKIFTLDSIAPVRPGLELVADNGISSSDLITNNANLRITNLEAGSTLQWRLKTTPPSTTWNLASSTFDVSSLGSGTYTVEVRQTDAAGNDSAIGPASDFTFTYVAPHATLNLNGQTSTLSYSGAAAVTLYPSILNDNYTFSSIKVGISSGNDTSNDKLKLGSWTRLFSTLSSNPNAANTLNATLTLDGAQTDLPLDWSYDAATRTFSFSRSNGLNFTGPQAQALERMLAFDSSSAATTGTRTLTLSSTDIAGNISTATRQVSVNPPATAIVGGAFTYTAADMSRPTLATWNAGTAVSPFGAVTLPALNFGGDLTLETWVRVNSTTNPWSRILDLGNGSATNNNLILTYEASNDKLSFHYYVGTAAVQNAGAQTNLQVLGDKPTVGEWMHVAVTISSTADSAHSNGYPVKLYQNGVLKDTAWAASLPTTLARSNNYLGKSNSGTDPFINASFSDLRIYDNTRSAAQIARDMLGTPDATSQTYFNTLTATTGLTLDNQTKALFLTQNGTSSATNNAYASLPSISIGGDLTIQTWVNFRSVSSSPWTRILELGNGSSSDNLILGINNSGQLFFTYYVGATRVVLAGSGTQPVLDVHGDAPVLGQWTNVAVTIGSTADAAHSNGFPVRFYVNGLLVDTAYAKTLPGTGPRATNTIGKSSFPGDPYFDGAAYDLNIFDSELTVTQIQQVMMGDTVADLTATKTLKLSGTSADVTSNTSGTSSMEYRNLSTSSGAAWLPQIQTQNRRALNLSKTDSGNATLPSLTFGTDLTIEMNVKFNTAPSNNSLLMYLGNANHGNGISFYVNNLGALEWAYRPTTGNTVYLGTGAVPVTNTWTHVAITFSKATDLTQSNPYEVRIYLDGVSQSPVYVASLPPSVLRNTNYIGNPNDTKTDISVYDLRIYDQNRTPQQIAADKLGIFNPNDSALVARYALDGSPDSSVSGQAALTLSSSGANFSYLSKAEVPILSNAKITDPGGFAQLQITMSGQRESGNEGLEIANGALFWYANLTGSGTFAYADTKVAYVASGPHNKITLKSSSAAGDRALVLADYEALLNSLRYTNTIAVPTAGNRIFSIALADSSGSVLGDPVTVNVDTIVSTPLIGLISDTGSSNTDGITKDAGLLISGLETGASWQYKVDGGAWQSGSGSSLNASTGTHTYAVRQTDAQGNVSFVSSNLSVTYINTIPAALSAVALQSDTGLQNSDRITNNATATVSGRGLANALQWALADNPNLIVWNTVNNSSSFTPTLEGVHTYWVRQVDAAGNFSATNATLNFTLDTQAPAAMTLSLNNATVENGLNVVRLPANATVSVAGFTPAQADHWEYRLGSNGSWQTGSGTSFSFASAANSATLQLSVRQVDTAGNASPPASVNVAWVSNTPTPTPSFVTDTGISNSDGISNQAAVTFDGANVAQSWTYRVDGGSAVTGTGSTFAAIPGSHTYTITSTDVWGNSATSAAVSLTLDTTAPAVPTLSYTSSNVLNTAVVTTSSIQIGVLESGATVEYNIDGGNTWTPISASGGSASISPALGQHTYVVRQTDVAGNPTSSTALALNRVSTGNSTVSLVDSAGVATLTSNVTFTNPQLGQTAITKLVPLISTSANDLIRIQVSTVSGFRDLVNDRMALGTTLVPESADSSGTNLVLSSNGSSVAVDWALTGGNSNPVLSIVRNGGGTFTAAEANVLFKSIGYSSTDTGTSGLHKFRITANNESGGTLELQASQISDTGITSTVNVHVPKIVLDLDGNSAGLNRITRTYPQVLLSGRSDAQNLSPAVLGSSAKPVQSVALPGISLGGTLTLEAWVNLSDVTTDGAKIISMEDAGFYGIYLGLKGTSGQISFQAYNDNNSTFLAPSGGLTADAQYSLSADTWAHVAVSVDSSNTATLYVNGVVAGSVGLGAAIDNHQRPNAYIGSVYGATSSTPLLKGTVADVRIYDSARTAQQIRGDMVGSIGTSNPDLRLSYAGPGLGYNVFNFNAPTSSAVSAPYVSLAPVTLGGDLTLEMWVNPTTAFASGKTRLLDLGDGLSGTGSRTVALGINSTGKLTFDAYNDASNATALVNLVSTTALSLNTWSHVAVTVNSSRLATLYINDVAVGTATLSSAITDRLRANTWLGKSEVTADNAFQGAIADVRIYDNARTLTQIGKDMAGAIDLNDANLRLATPLMQGTGDWSRSFVNVRETLPGLLITGSSGTALSYSTVTASTVASTTLPGVQIGGDFTLEAWVKPSNLVSGYQIFLDLGDTSTSGTATIGKNSIYLAMDGGSGNSGKVSFKAISDTSTKLNELISPSAIPLNSWSHVAVTVDSSLNSTLYINGLPVATGTLTSAVANLLRTKTFVGKGEWSAEPNFQGSVADVRVYDSARTATEIGQDMSGIINTSDKNLRLAYDTPGVKYGVFNLDNQAQTAANQNGVSLPSVVIGGDLTMEIWVNPAKLDSNYAKFLTLSETDLSDNLFLGFDRTTGKVQFLGYQASTQLVNIASPTALTLDTWTHVAATINSNNVATLYINGVSVATATLTTAFNNFTTGTAYLGRSSAWQDDYFSGALADARVYNDARTAAEIQADMKGGYDPSDTNLLIATPGLASTTGSGGSPALSNEWSSAQSAIASLVASSAITLPVGVTGLTEIEVSFTGTSASDLLYYGSSAKSLSLQSDSSITWVDQGLTWTVANTVSGQTSKVSFTSSLATGVTVAQMQSVLKTLGYYSTAVNSQVQIGIQLFDAAGNSSPLQQVALNSTVAAPTLTLDQDTGSSASDGLTNAALMRISGVEEGGSFAWQLDNSAWQTGSGSTLTAIEGVHSYALVQMDARGNRSSISTFRFNYHAAANVTAPVVVLSPDSGRSNSDGISNNRSLAVNFDQHFASGNSWRYKVDNSASWSTGSGNTLQGMEGAHTYTVEFTDVAGNVVSTTSPTFVIDTVVATPQIALTVDSGRSSSDGITNNPQITISGLEAQAYWYYSVDGSTPVPGNSANSFFNAQSGTHTYRVTQTDVAGNASGNSNTLSVNYVVANLSAPGLAFSSDTGTAGDGVSSQPTISVSGISASGWQFRVDGGAWQTSSGNTFQATLGSHTYQVQQFDDAGNTGLSSIVTLNYYNSVPAAPTLTLVSDSGGSSTDNYSNNPAVSISGLVAGASAQYKVDGSDWQTLAEGVSTFNASTGSHTYIVRQIHNASGLTSADSGTQTFNIDTTAPSVSVLAQSLGVGQKLHFSSSETGSAYLVPATAQIASLADILALPATSRASVTVTAASTDTLLNTTGLNTGTYKLYSVDAVDNVSAASSNTIQLLPAPSIAITFRDSSGNTQLGTLGVGSVMRFRVQLSTSATLTADGTPSYAFKLGSRNLSAPINRASSSASELVFDYALKPGDGSGSLTLRAINNDINPLLLGGARLTNTASGAPLNVAADYLGFVSRTVSLASAVGGSDTSVPTLISSSLSSGTRTLNKGDIGSLNWVLVFSEPVTGLSATSLSTSSATVGTLGSLVSTGSTVYTIPVTLGNNVPSGTLGLTLSASGIADAAGNAFTAAASALSLSMSVDTAAPNAPTLALASGLVASSVSLTQATTGTGVLTVAGESAGSASVILTGVSGTINRTITTSGSASPQPLVLTAADVALLGSGVVNVQATVRDAAGNDSLDDSISFTLQTSKPVVQSVSDNVAGVLTRAQTSITYTMTFDRAVFGLTAADFTVTNATLNSVSMSLDSTVATLSLTPASGVAGNIGITLAANGVFDSANNFNDVFTTNAQVIDTLKPSVSSITLSSSTPALSTIKTGTQVFADVLFSEVVQVSGTPRLNLQIGSNSRIATYASGTGTDTLRFAYTVASGDADSNGVSVSAGSISLPSGAQSATLRDVNGNDATLSFSAVADASGVKVDAVAPTMAFAASQSALDTLTERINLTFSEPITGLTSLSQLQITNVSDQSVSITNSNCSNFTYNAATNTASFDVSGLDGSGQLRIGMAANTVTDAAGNPNPSLGLTRSYARTIALPNGMGKLILGVQVAGLADAAGSQNWYYHWDKNGNGIADAGDAATYTEMLNMVTATSASSWINANHFKLAIPTMTALSPPSADNDASSSITPVANGGGTSYALSPAKTAANSQGTTPNAKHDGLTAIWDAFNGSAVSKPANVAITSADPLVGNAATLSNTDQSSPGLPPGWGVADTRANDEQLDSFYWSSLTFEDGVKHGTFSLQTGFPDAGAVTNDYHYGAFKVIIA